MMVRGVFSTNMQEQYEATQKFRKLLSIGRCLRPWFKLQPSCQLEQPGSS